MGECLGARVSRSLSIFLVFAGLNCVPGAYGYSSYIGYGHSTCLSCHFNAYGGGLLTSYGRAISASTIAAKPLYAPDADDNALAESSGFLGPIAYPAWLETAASYRGFYRVDHIESGADASWLNDRADFSIALKPAAWIWAVGNIGYESSPVTAGYPDKNWISREHYLALEPFRNFRLYAGLLASIYGVRPSEYDVYARTRTGLGAYSQSHSVVTHYATEKMDAGIQAFFGNYLSPVSAREKGVTLSYEYEPAEAVRVGSSVMYAQNTLANRYMGALFARVSAGDGSSILAELGTVRRRSFGREESDPFDTYFMLQTMSRFARGAHFLLTSEFQTDNIIGPAPRRFKVAPGFLYVPAQRLELRATLQATRTVGGPTVENDGVNFITELALWF